MPVLTKAPTNRAREYETIYILRSDVDPDTAERVANRVTEVIERESGKLLKVENWGRRRLAYEINRQKRGIYTYVKYLGGGSLVKELERNLRLQDVVIRHQTVLLRTDIVTETVTIDPEETKFTRVELPGEDDKEDSKERLLGFLDSPDEKRHSRRDGEYDDFDDLDNEVSLNPDLVSTDKGEDKLVMAAYIQVVLREPQKNLGKSGELVRVRPGFARNFLVPRQLAVYATEKNVARLEHEKREALSRAAKLKVEAESVAGKLNNVTVTIKRAVGGDERMYGSVTAKDIAAALAEAGHTVDRRKLELKDAIRTLGTHDVSVRLAPEVTSTFKVAVVKA